MPLDADVEAILKALADQGGPPFHELGPDGAREIYRAMASPPPDVELAEVRDLDCPGPAGNIALRLYKMAAQEGLPLIMYFHGGGWTIGDLDTHDGLCRQLAAGTGAVVLAVDYRLAPEDPYPAAFLDCHAATCWAHANAAELGADAGKIFLAGDSAGGNLAAAVTNRVTQEQAFVIQGQVLMCPAMNCDFETESYTENAEGYLLSRETMMWFWDQYTGEVNRNEPSASPLRDPLLDPPPPALVVTAEFDPLRDEGQAYVEHLKEHGGEAELAHYDGVVHGFVHMNAQIAKGFEALTRCSDWLKSRF